MVPRATRPHRNGRIEWKDAKGRALKSLQEAAVGEEHDPA
jgi:hypothetical protein